MGSAERGIWIKSLALTDGATIPVVVNEALRGITHCSISGIHDSVTAV